MKTMEMKAASRPVAAYATGLGRESLVFTVRGKPVAALVSLRNTDVESLEFSANPRFLRLIARSRSLRKQRGGLTAAALRRRLAATARTP